MKGGGSQTSTVSTKLPKWIEEASKQYLSMGQSVSSGLAKPYQGELVAEMTPEQRAALGRMTDLSNFSLTPEVIQGQMNPYIQNVEEAALTQGRKALAQNLNQISDAAIRSGGAFGSRQGVREGVAASESADAQAQLSAQLRAQGYQNAVANALAGQQAAMGAAQAGFGAGSALQQQAQSQLAADEARYNAMRNYPIEQLNILGSTLSQTPYGTSQVSSAPMSGSPLLGAMGGAMGFKNIGLDPWLGGSLGFIAGYPLGSSDRSMKTDVKKIGKDKESGLDMYSYRYKGDPKTYPKMVGPMADDIEDKYPEKVKKVAGKKVVNMNFLMGKVKY